MITLQPVQEHNPVPLSALRSRPEQRDSAYFGWTRERWEVRNGD